MLKIFKHKYKLKKKLLYNIGEDIHLLFLKNVKKKKNYYEIRKKCINRFKLKKRVLSNLRWRYFRNIKREKTLWHKKKNELLKKKIICLSRPKFWKKKKLLIKKKKKIVKLKKIIKSFFYKIKKNFVVSKKIKFTKKSNLKKKFFFKKNKVKLINLKLHMFKIKNNTSIIKKNKIRLKKFVVKRIKKIKLKKRKIKRIYWSPLTLKAKILFFKKFYKRYGYNAFTKYYFNKKKKFIRILNAKLPLRYSKISYRLLINYRIQKIKSLKLFKIRKRKILRRKQKKELFLKKIEQLLKKENKFESKKINIKLKLNDLIFKVKKKKKNFNLKNKLEIKKNRIKNLIKFRLSKIQHKALISSKLNYFLKNYKSTCKPLSSLYKNLKKTKKKRKKKTKLLNSIIKKRLPFFSNMIENTKNVTNLDKKKKEFSKTLIKSIKRLSLNSLQFYLYKRRSIKRRLWAVNRNIRRLLVSRNFKKKKKADNKNLKFNNFKEISKAFSFKPKIKFKRLRKPLKTSKSSIVSYKGQYYNFLKFSLFFGGISKKKIKKISHLVKNKYTKNLDFTRFFLFKLYFFLYYVNLLPNFRKSYLYIKKFGLLINFKKSYNPIAILRVNDIIEFNGPIKINFLEMILSKRPRSKLKYWIRKFPFSFLFNHRILALLILKKDLNNFILNVKKKFYMKKKVAKVSARIILNFCKYGLRRK